MSPRKRAASRTTDGIIEPSSKKKRSGVSYKELDRLRRIAYGGDTVQKDVFKSGGATYDPWAVEETAQSPNASLIPVKKPIREPVTLKHPPISLSANGKPIPAIKIPDAGRSYNPKFEDWDELVTREGDKEVAAERARIDAAAAEQAQRERALVIATEPDPAEDDDEENESAWESEWEGIISEPDDATLRQRRPHRKTQAERNKANRRREAECQARHEAAMRHRDTQAAQILAIAHEIEKQGRGRAGALARKEETEESSENDGAEEVLRRKRFGKVRVPEAPLEVVLADELQDSLRLLRPEGNLLKDRYRSMLVRGKMETRRPIAQRKKARTVVTEKWSYKDWKAPRVKGS